jgi:hypothetical protein
MEATSYSETSVDCQLTTLLYIPEGRTLHTHICENLKYCIGATLLLLRRADNLTAIY